MLNFRAKSLILLGVFFLVAFDAAAQTYPAKVVRLVVPFSPGSGADNIGRIVAGGMSEVFGQQVIVDNRAGAAGNIGTEMAARAPHDGHTLLLAIMGHTANASLYRKLSYDLLRDFAPVTQLATSPAILSVHPSLPVKSVRELVTLAKARPGVINYASGGVGTPTFLVGELFKGQAGIDLQHVPYRSGGEALTSIVAGEASVYFAPLAPALPLIQAGRLRALATTGVKRGGVLGELPTVAESGYPGFEFGFWYGFLVPAKTPKQTIAAIRNAAVSALNKPEISKRMQDLGYIVIGDQPEEFAQLIKSNIEKWRKIIREKNITAD